MERKLQELFDFLQKNRTYNKNPKSIKEIQIKAEEFLKLFNEK